MIRPVPILALALGLAAALVGAPARAGLTVVADIAPVHSVVAAVMQGAGAPELLIDGAAADPHDASLRPSQRRLVAGADLVVMVGGGLTPWLDRLADAARLPTLALVKVAGTHLRGTGDGAGQFDRHAWLDPGNAGAWAAAIADALAARDPANADTYHRNAALFRAELDAATAEARTLLATRGGGGIVTSHDALGYFADAFGLNIVGAIADGDDTPPSAARMAALRRLAEEGAVDCILVEAGAATGRAAAIAGDLPLRIASFDPLGRDLAPGPALYRRLIRALARSIATCLPPAPGG